MAEVKGLGICLINTAAGTPCGKQIQEGEPIGTIMVGNNPIIGHRKCADGYIQRENAMKLGKQQGPGGSIGDPSSYQDALAFGSAPLDKPSSQLDNMAMPEGVTPLSELPMDTTIGPPPPGVTQSGLIPKERVVLGDAAHRTPVPSNPTSVAQVPAASEPITHTINIDMTAVPDNTQRLQINLNWPDE